MLVRLTSLVIGSFLLVVAVACPSPSGDGDGDGDGDSDVELVVNELVDEVLTPTLDDAVSAIADLREKTALLGDDPENSEAVADARAAYSVAMAAWQRVEVMQLGPLGSIGVSAGGQGLRDEVYSWPTTTPCAVDQQIVANSFAEENYFDGRLVNTYGLDALEYLLFHDGDDNSCSPAAAINTSGDWAQLSSIEIRGRRASYAAVLGTLVNDDAVNAQIAFADFANVLKAPDGDVVNDHQHALDELFAALYYIELRVKDKKLAVPLGLHIDCSSTVCPEQVESPHAQISAENLTANLQMARDLFTGKNGRNGFGFLLDDRGQSVLHEEMLAALDETLTSIDSLPGTFAHEIETNVTNARLIYDDVKDFTDRLKTQFVTTLGVRVPDEGAGDND